MRTGADHSEEPQHVLRHRTILARAAAYVARADRRRVRHAAALLERARGSSLARSQFSTSWLGHASTVTTLIIENAVLRVLTDKFC